MFLGLFQLGIAQAQDGSEIMSRGGPKKGRTNSLGPSVPSVQASSVKTLAKCESGLLFNVFFCLNFAAVS